MLSAYNLFFCYSGRRASWHGSFISFPLLIYRLTSDPRLCADILVADLLRSIGVSSTFTNSHNHKDFNSTNRFQRTDTLFIIRGDFYSKYFPICLSVNSNFISSAFDCETIIRSKGSR